MSLTLRVSPHHDHADDHDEHAHPEWCPPLDRRAALRLLGMTGIAALSGCGTGGTVASTPSSGTTATTTSLTASASSVAAGTAETLTAAVSPSAATGTVTFYDGTTALGTGSLTSGMASLAASFSTAGGHSVAAAYAGSSAYAASTSAAVAITVTAAATTASCSASLEGEEGPYFVDDSASGYMRSNVLSNLDGTNTQTGIPLTVTIYVYDAKSSCAAMQGVQVDIWHCNSSGVYSAEAVESTTGQSWLRGYQITDSYGMVQFQTIVPGWYSGRTTHIHLRFRSTYDWTSTSGSNTMQIFFDQALLNTLSTSVAPYSREGTNPVTNASDRVYTTEEDGTTLLTLSGSASAGFTASFKAYMPIHS